MPNYLNPFSHSAREIETDSGLKKAHPGGDFPLVPVWWIPRSGGAQLLGAFSLGGKIERTTKKVSYKWLIREAKITTCQFLCGGPKWRQIVAMPV
jgi:hypothetical protein